MQGTEQLCLIGQSLNGCEHFTLSTSQLKQRKDILTPVNVTTADPSPDTYNQCPIAFGAGETKKLYIDLSWWLNKITLQI